MSDQPHDEDEPNRHADDGVDESGEDDGVGEAIDGDDGGGDAEAGGPRAELERTKARLEAEADRAVSEFDQGVVDLLAWLLDTETRARIYVYLRQHPRSTSDEIADGTGLYPSTVREALAELHDEGTVSREKRESDGAGNNPYEYEAIAPSSLVRGVVGEIQRELNTVFNLEGRFGDDDDGGPVTITIGDDAADDADGADTDADGAVTIDVEDAAEDDTSATEDGDRDDGDRDDGGEDGDRDDEDR